MTSDPLSKIPSARSKKLLKELPTEPQMHSILVNLTKAGDRATAVMGAAYLEHALELLLKAHFRPLGKEENTRMFDGSQGAILGTFSAKIRVAYATKLLHRNAYRALLLINDIRNVFAHSLHKVTFSDPDIIEDCKTLLTLSAALTDNAGVTESDRARKIYARVVRTLFVSLRMLMERVISGEQFG